MGNFVSFITNIISDFVVFSFHDINIVFLKQSTHPPQLLDRIPFATLKVIIEHLSFFLLNFLYEAISYL